jgi:hypothetical protein
VHNFLRQSQLVSAPLLELSKILKSQDKIAATILDQVNKCRVELTKQWRTVFPDKNVFIKLHHIEAHVTHFILMYQMYDRLSEDNDDGNEGI